MLIHYASLLLQRHVYQRLAQLTELRELALDTKMLLSMYTLNRRQKQYQSRWRRRNQLYQVQQGPRHLQHEQEQLQYLTRHYSNRPLIHSNTIETAFRSGSLSWRYTPSWKSCRPMGSPALSISQKSTRWLSTDLRSEIWKEFVLRFSNTFTPNNNSSKTPTITILDLVQQLVHLLFHLSYKQILQPHV